MKKLWHLVFIINLLPLLANGQTAYLLTDSSTALGVNLIDGGVILNSRVCQVEKNKKIIKYSPYQVKEYKFEDGRTYQSFPVKIKDSTWRYFLERLVEGKINLYYLKLEDGNRKYYLIKRDSTRLLEIPEKEKEFRELFETLVNDCPQAIRNIPYTYYRQMNFQRFIQDYNNCSDRPLPRFRYGFIVGSVITHLINLKDGKLSTSTSNHNKDWGISYGAFIDFPIFSSNFSFHPEINYQDNNIEMAIDNDIALNDLIIDYSRIGFPLLFRYSMINKLATPFIQFGPVYSRMIKNKATWYQYQFNHLGWQNQSDLYINFIDSSPLQKNMAGFSVGSGIILKYGSKYSWFAELRYDKLYNIEHENKLLNISDFKFSFGIIF